MRELIKKILREQLSPNVKRRLNTLDMDKLVNLKKLISFNPRMSVDDNVKNTIRKISGEIYPSDNVFSTDEEYESSWDLLIDALIKKYSDELTEYFTNRKEEYENRTSEPFIYTFVKHDERNFGFSQSFPNLESLVYQMGDYLPNLDWYEVKGKLDKVDYFPNNNFTGTYSSNRMLISPAGADGNNWGYSFSIIKSIPQEYLDRDTKKPKKNIQESKKRISKEERNTKSTNKEFSKYKDSKFNSLREYTLQDIVDNWESLSDHKNDNIKTIKYFVNNPDKITDLVYDEKGLEDGYHRLIAAKILKKPRFTYKMVEE